jgi:hypothetical protein
MREDFLVDLVGAASGRFLLTWAPFRRDFPGFLTASQSAVCRITPHRFRPSPCANSVCIALLEGMRLSIHTFGYGSLIHTFRYFPHRTGRVGTGRDRPLGPPARKRPGRGERAASTFCCGLRDRTGSAISLPLPSREKPSRRYVEKGRLEWWSSWWAL